MVAKLLAQHTPRYLAVALDTPGPTFRDEIYGEYKANRPPPPPDLAQQMERIVELLRLAGWPVLGRPGVEADDIIASLAAWVLGEQMEAVIVSADKDLLQLVGPRCRLYDVMRERVLGIEETREKLGVAPEQVADWLALTGDRVDNIPGVPGVGAKTATELLRAWGTLQEIYDNLEDIPKPALRRKLQENRAQAELSRALTGLRRDISLVRDVDELMRKPVQAAPLLELAQRLELSRLAQDIGMLTGDKASAQMAAADLSSTAPGQVDASAQVDASIQVEASITAHRATDYLLDNGSLDEGRLRQLFAELEKAELALLDAEEEADCQDRHPRWHLAWPAGVFTFTLQLSASREPGYGEGYRGQGHNGQGHKEASTPDRDDTPSAEERLLRRLLSGRGWRWGAVDGETLRRQASRLQLPVPELSLDFTLGSYLLHSERGPHRLAALAERHPEWWPGGGLSLDRAIAAAQAARAAPALCRCLDETGVGHLLRQVELPLARVLAEMERTGVLLDLELLARLRREAGDELEALEVACKTCAGADFNIQSPRQLESILFDRLALPVIKRTKTARSTDHSVLEELSPLHELPSLILRHRELSKLKATYLDVLPRAVDQATGRLHTRFHQSVAATGRLSSSDPNVQNIPVKGEFGARIRKAFVAPQGWCIMAADYSQIELRVLAHLSGDEQLAGAYRKAADVHVQTACALFDIQPERVTREQRAQAKTVNFAVVYGQSQFALARSLGIERREAKRYIDAFFARYAGVRAYFTRVLEEARERGEVRTLLGRRRGVADLRSKNAHLRAAAERVACNTPVQGSAADILKKAMLDVQSVLEEAKARTRMVLTVHDELVFELFDQEAETLPPKVVAAMCMAVPLDVPLVVDWGCGPNWADAKS